MKPDEKNYTELPLHKNGFLNFCFAFLPGVGQMYQGYMKRGISILVSFGLSLCVLQSIASTLFLLSAVVIWFASFFDTFHLAQRVAGVPEDDWIWNAFSLTKEMHCPGKRRAAGVCIILLGLWMCIECMPYFLSALGVDLGGVTWVLRRYIPSFIVAGALIWFGVRFLFLPVPVDESATWQAPTGASDSREEPSAVLPEDQP